MFGLTHLCSLFPVPLVAQRCQMEIDLGIKEKSGILQSMSTRAAFLSDSTHRIRFVYIPKHTSWLNLA
jgi:hypothetical protein